MGQQAHFDPPVPKPDMDVEIAPTVPDAQSAPNAVVGDGCLSHVSMVDPPHEIPLTQNHPSKCLNRMVFGSLSRSLHLFLSFFPHFSTDVAGDIPKNMDVPPVAAQVHFGDGFRGSSSVEIIHDSKPYEMARALNSDDDRPVGELTESDVEMMRRIFPGRRDPRVHEFNDLAHSDQAFAEGRDDELLEAPKAGPNMVIENGRVFNDVPALKRWL